MTNNSNNIIAPTAQAATPAITLTSFPCSKVALPFASPFLCLHHFTWQRYALSRAPSSPNWDLTHLLHGHWQLAV